MIELYDASRLEGRRDLVLIAVPLVAAVVLLGYGAYAWSLHGRVQRAEAELAALKGRLPQAAPPSAAGLPAADATLLADLQRRAESAEAAADPAGAPPGPAPSHWMGLLERLSRSDASLDKVEIDRAGQVRLEGRATGAPAVSAFVLGWDRLQEVAALGPRSVELREDKAIAPLLRFQMQASLRTAAGAPR